MSPHVLFLRTVLTLLIGISLAACGQKKTPIQNEAMDIKTEMNNDEWKTRLSPEEYRVLRECGTEPAFTGKFWNHHGEGVYVCAACGEKLFSSEAKFESGSGWPSYFAPVTDSSIGKTQDRSHGMVRTEIHCASCGGHLGHVFNDGPQPTGLRYCVNSVSLDFIEKTEDE